MSETDPLSILRARVAVRPHLVDALLRACAIQTEAAKVLEQPELVAAVTGYDGREGSETERLALLERAAWLRSPHVLLSTARAEVARCVAELDDHDTKIAALSREVHAPERVRAASYFETGLALMSPALAADCSRGEPDVAALRAFFDGVEQFSAARTFLGCPQVGLGWLLVSMVEAFADRGLIPIHDLSHADYLPPAKVHAFTDWCRAKSDAKPASPGTLANMRTTLRRIRARDATLPNLPRDLPVYDAADAPAVTNGSSSNGANPPKVSTLARIRSAVGLQ